MRYDPSCPVIPAASEASATALGANGPAHDTRSERVSHSLLLQGDRLRTGDEGDLALAVSLRRNGGSSKGLDSGSHGDREGSLVAAGGLSGLKISAHL